MSLKPRPRTRTPTTIERLLTVMGVVVLAVFALCGMVIVVCLAVSMVQTTMETMGR